MFNRNIYAFLKKWSRKSNRKPLVVRGARQVGKTVAITRFSKKFFRDLIYLNMEKNDHLAMFRRVLPVDELVQLIQLKTGKKITPGSTLLFIDEIQMSGVAMTQLRYFFEEMPELHVIAAGSLLEIKMKKEGFSFPVGRVEYSYMYPVSFDEFLEAAGDGETLSFINKLATASESGWNRITA